MPDPPQPTQVEAHARNLTLLSHASLGPQLRSLARLIAQLEQRAPSSFASPSSSSSSSSSADSVLLPLLLHTSPSHPSFPEPLAPSWLTVRGGLEQPLAGGSSADLLPQQQQQQTPQPTPPFEPQNGDEDVKVKDEEEKPKLEGEEAAPEAVEAEEWGVRALRRRSLTAQKELEVEAKDVKPLVSQRSSSPSLVPLPPREPHAPSPSPRAPPAPRAPKHSPAPKHPANPFPLPLSLSQPRSAKFTRSPLHAPTSAASSARQRAAGAAPTAEDALAALAGAGAAPAAADAAADASSSASSSSSSAATPRRSTALPSRKRKAAFLVPPGRQARAQKRARSASPGIGMGEVGEREGMQREEAVGEEPVGEEAGEEEAVDEAEGEGSAEDSELSDPDEEWVNYDSPQPQKKKKKKAKPQTQTKAKAKVSSTPSTRDPIYLPSTGQALTTDLIRSSFRLPASLDLSPPASFGVPSPETTNLRFWREHLGGKPNGSVNEGTSGGVYYPERNHLCLQMDMNVAGVHFLLPTSEGGGEEEEVKEAIAPGQPIAFVSNVRKTSALFEAVVKAVKGKVGRGINVLVAERIGEGPWSGKAPPNSWIYKGKYDLAYDGRSGMVLDSSDPLHPEIERVLAAHGRSTKGGWNAEILSGAGGLGFTATEWDDGVRKKGAGTELKEAREREEGKRVVRFIVLRCVGWDEECWRIWEGKRTGRKVEG
ncbi:hypothetical protein JCM10213v2_007707 [Rhodosporidiobolus nylandii]